MKVFEFHFNPRGTEAKVFETFVYEPETSAEEKQGFLYLAGSLNNVLPQNIKLLDSLAQVMKKEYYGESLDLKRSLEKVNGFLSAEVKKENVSWLGNLNFALLSLSAENSGQDWQEFNFTKTGDTKMMLVRGDEIVDISAGLETESSYSSKIFKNVSTGRLLSGDKIIVLDKDIFEFLSSRGLIKKVLFAATQKELKQIFNSCRKEMEQFSGFCLFITLKRSRKIFKRPKLGFVLLPFKIIGKLFSLLLRFKKPKPVSINSPLPGIRAWFSNIRENWRERNFVVIILLILTLAVGYLIFSPEKKAEIARTEQAFTEIKAKVLQAEDLLALGKETEADLLFREAYQKIAPLTVAQNPRLEDAIILKDSIEESLFVLNKLDADPVFELLFKFNSDFVPQRMMIFDSELYFYNPFSPYLYWFDIEEKSGRSVEAGQNLKLGAVANKVVLFTTPNILYSLQEDEFSELELELPYPDFSFDLMAGFKNNIYFLDKNSGEIIRYSGESAPVTWLRDDTERQEYHGSASMVIDGSIWVLNNNEINRYHSGRLMETFKIDTFPALQNPTKIWTSSSHSYLYLLEPGKNRIIVLDRQGEIVKQLQSEKFGGLKDLSVSPDGRTIYLLNGSEVYQLSF